MFDGKMQVNQRQICYKQLRSNQIKSSDIVHRTVTEIAILALEIVAGVEICLHDVVCVFY